MFYYLLLEKRKEERGTGVSVLGSPNVRVLVTEGKP